MDNVILRRPRSAIVLLLVMLAGCGSGDSIGDVAGTVTLNGKPLTSAKVVFYPERGPAASGVLDAEGRFTLTTHAAGDGAMIGKHAVTVVPLSRGVPPEAMAAMESKDAKMPSLGSASPAVNIPLRYQRAETSKLTFEVKPGGNEFVIKLDGVN